MSDIVKSDEAAESPEAPESNEAGTRQSTVRRAGLALLAPAVGVMKRSPRSTIAVGALLVVGIVAVVVAATVPAPPPAAYGLDLPSATATARTPSAAASASPSASASPTPTPTPSPTASAQPTSTSGGGTEHLTGGFTSVMPTLTPTSSDSPSPTDTAPVDPNYAPPGALTLQQYLALAPSFGPPPAPVPVTMPHDPGLPAVFESIPTTQPVAFLTVDDGYHTYPLYGDLVRQTGVPLMQFLLSNQAAYDPGFFASLLRDGMVIDNHTVDHPELPTLSYDQQKAEICGGADGIAQLFGRRPTNFRPPYLEWNDDTVRAAGECGVTAIISGNVSVDANTISYHNPDRTIHPGDIIILHYDYDFATALITALQAIKAAGLTPALLTKYFTVAA